VTPDRISERNMPEPKPILNYRPQGPDPQARLDRLDRADRVLVKLAIAFILLVTVIAIVSAFV
jgi:hypothetical protein